MFKYILFQIIEKVQQLGFSIYPLADILVYEKCDYVRHNHPGIFKFKVLSFPYRLVFAMSLKNA